MSNNPINNQPYSPQNIPGNSGFSPNPNSFGPSFGQNQGSSTSPSFSVQGVKPQIQRTAPPSQPNFGSQTSQAPYLPTGQGGQAGDPLPSVSHSQTSGQVATTTGQKILSPEEIETAEYQAGIKQDADMARKLGLQIPGHVADPIVLNLWRSYLRTLLTAYYESMIEEKDIPTFLSDFDAVADTGKEKYLNNFGNFVADQIAERRNIINMMEVGEQTEKFESMMDLLPEDLQKEYLDLLTKMENGSSSEEEYNRVMAKISDWGKVLESSLDDNERLEKQNPTKGELPNGNMQPAANPSNPAMPVPSTQGGQVLSTDDLSNYLNS